MKELMTVSIDELIKAKWNYKTDGSEEQIQKLMNSIEYDKSAGVLAVRKVNDKYEVITQNRGRSSYYKCIIKTKIKSKIIHNYCNSKGIQLTGKVWDIPIHKQQVFKKYAYKSSFKNAEKFSYRSIALPLGTHLKKKDLNLIVNSINKVL